MSNLDGNPNAGFLETGFICGLGPGIVPFEPRYEKTGFLDMRKQRRRSFSAVTTKLISAFVFAIRIVKSLYFISTKFQDSSLLL